MNWKEIIDIESAKEYYKNIYVFLQEDSKKHDIFTLHKDLLSALKLTPLENVKVVILGQDPYHGPNQAHGLSFSVPGGVAIPPSLKNIFKEVTSDLGLTEKFPDGCLTGWAKQGVLLLNSVLTVRAGEANSHRDIGWETFTDALIESVNQLSKPVVIMLWGASARSKKRLLTNDKHLVLEAAHPSPLSAHNGFFGCKHFSQANQFLLHNNVSPIRWEST
jgi:uracil-DNA glycosylase